MDAIAGKRVSRDALHKTVWLALATCQLHRQLRDPELVLANAAADYILKTLAASGFVLTVAACRSSSATAIDFQCSKPPS